MYTCVNAILRLRGENTRMSEAQVGDVLVRDLVTKYSVVRLILTHPAIKNKVSLDINDVLSRIYQANPSFTVDQWLTSLGNESLPVKDTVPKIVTASVKYNDAFNAGYTLNRIHPTSGEGNEMPDEDLTDIRITRGIVDYKQFYESIVVSVNGLLHISDYSTAGVKVKDAGRSVSYSNKNTIGLMSFREVGKLSFEPIKADMLKPLNEGRLLKDGFSISLPKVNLDGKVAMLSIGGFLHFGNDRYNVNGDHSIMVDWAKIPFAHRYYDSNKLIDLSSFNQTMVRNDAHGDALDLNQALSDESIRAYMSLPQSFIILLETDHFFYQQHQLERTALLGRYYAYEPPAYPLQLDNGLLPPYVAIKEDDVYTVAIEDNNINRYVHDTRPVTDDGYFNSDRKSNRRTESSSGYLLQMGRDYLKD